MDSELTELKAAGDCFKTLADLHRLDGSLLARRGISTPGPETVEELEAQAASAGATNRPGMRNAAARGWS